MTLSTPLVAKLLIATATIPTLGYGGYCVYDHYYPTFHNQLINQGFIYSPVSDIWGIGEEDIQRPRDISSTLGGDWRCSKQMFGDIDTPTIDTDDSESKSDLPMPQASKSNATEGKPIGCLVVDLGHADSSTNKRAGFLKWELALRSGDKGFIYVGYLSVGSFKESHNHENQQSFSMVFEVDKDKEKEEWNIKQGLGWSDYFSDVASSSDSTLNLKIDVVLPNAYAWSSEEDVCSFEGNTRKNKCPGREQWTFQKYVGFWEEDDEGEERVIDAIEIKATKGSTVYQHDVWSNDVFDFDVSRTSRGETSILESGITHIYIPGEGKWGTPGSSSRNAKEYLKTIYKPWTKKQGTWKEAKDVCHESDDRSMSESDALGKTLINFCYKK